MTRALGLPDFPTPKPERLIREVLEIASDPGDLVDAFAGSGATGAVAHKMGRRWIMVEVGEHCHTHIIPRLRKVIDGEDPAASPRPSAGKAAAASVLSAGAGFGRTRRREKTSGMTGFGEVMVEQDRTLTSALRTPRSPN